VRYEDLNQSDSFITYPTNCIVCVIDKASDVDSLLRELNSHGYFEDEVRILFSKKGAERLDPDGRDHGKLAKLYRLMETAALESKTLREFYAELMNGHLVFMVHTDDHEEVREAWSILRSYDARRATFYGRWIVERVA
jgi:hypothetical protein